MAATMAAGVWCAGATAHATHPDHEGERGFELSLSAGVGGIADTDERLFLAPRDVAPGAPSYEAFTNGFAVQGQLGYRIAPFVSAGVSFNVQSLEATQLHSPQEMGFGARDSFSSWQMGVYGRFYPVALMRRHRDNPRVFFQGWGDLRRLDPWVSLGLTLTQNVTRERAYSDALNRTTWETGFVGVPIGFGAEYRITQSLAAGVQFTVTPLVGGGVDKTQQARRTTGSTDAVSVTESSYDPIRTSTVQTFFGLSVRYTLTLF
jgi:hypothetical protein